MACPCVTISHHYYSSIIIYLNAFNKVGSSILIIYAK